MSPDLGQTMIPARITAQELAGTIGVEVSAVTGVLTARGEPDSPKDVMPADLAIAVAGVLGHRVVVEARDLALEKLYELDGRHGESDDEDLPPRVRRIVEGVQANREQLDNQIEAASKHWSIARMPMIDRTILRLSLWELTNEPATPTAVVVSEAVRLANTYSTGRSGAFINGVLAALAKSVR